jgi:NTP pyrophosphatase (non-canonical NTP hydrolase)
MINEMYLQQQDAMFDTIEALSEYNEPEYNRSKLAEELAELLEVLLKLQNKKGIHIPPREKVVEEIGDVIFRAYVYIQQEAMEEEVEARMIFKANKLQGYIDNKTYSKNV